MRKVLPLIVIFMVLSFAVIDVANAQRSSSKQQNSIERLKNELRHQLMMLPYYGVFDWLEAEVKDESTVVLRGQVMRPTTKSDAEHRVGDIEGIETVINEIEVLPLSPNDNRLRRAVYRALFNDNSRLFMFALSPVPSIHIIIKNGRCTLKGLVTSKADSDYANIKARGVAGLFEVINELQTEKTSRE